MSQQPNSLPIASVLLPILGALAQDQEISSSQTHAALLAVLGWIAGPEPLLLPQSSQEPPKPSGQPPSTSTAADAPPLPDRELRRELEGVQVAKAEAVQAIARRLELLEQTVHELRDKVTDTGPPLLTKKAFLREFPNLYSKSGLDKVLFMRQDNGLNDFGAIYQRKKGCRVLIDPKRFLEWYRWFHGRAPQGPASGGPRS